MHYLTLVTALGAAVLSLVSVAHATPSIDAAPGVRRSWFIPHDNEITFAELDDNRLRSIEFHVTAFYISPGEEPTDPPNMIGDIHNSTRDIAVDRQAEGEPTLSFRSGRHGTTYVADWWNENIDPSQVNYNDKPTVMNFAFAGDMRILWDSGETLHLGSFFLGQTHKGLSNPWYIGGKHCRNEGKSCQILCDGFSENNYRAQVRFYRGGSGDECYGKDAFGQAAARIQVLDFQKIEGPGPSDQMGGGG